MKHPKTIIEKIWDRHVILERGEQCLLYVDRHLVHDGSFHAFANLHRRGLSVRRPGQTFAVPDHYVPTTGRTVADAVAPEFAEMISSLERNASRHQLVSFAFDDPRQGIVHIVGPEQGITLPGLVMVCGDSHTSTHGALGAFAFGIGQSENAHVLATQTLWQRRPKTLRVNVEGTRGAGVSAKDVVLAIIGRLGAGGGVGHVIEYDGAVIRAMSIEERLTVCNMSIEAGARAGLVAPDDTTFQYIAGRPFAPAGTDWDRMVAFWKTLPSDPEASFSRQVHIDGGDLEPMVTWGTSPEHVVSIRGRVPDPRQAPDSGVRQAWQEALAYSGLQPGAPLIGTAIDRVFIGSCTNARIEDLRAAAAIARRGRARVPAIVVPGSESVRQQAQREGLDRVFLDAGFEWRHAGCSMCAAMNGDIGRPGERIASTSNRNFPGRQGPGVRTHLMSPAMAAAAALAGALTDVRTLQ